MTTPTPIPCIKALILGIVIGVMSSNTWALLPSQSDLNIEKIKKNLITIEIWKRPINPKTGRRHFNVRDSLVQKGMGFRVGKDYILTARHLVTSILKEEKYTYLKMITESGEILKGLMLSRCEDIKTIGKSIDLCLFKAPSLTGVGLEFPKIPNLIPKNETYAIINRSPHIGKPDQILTGEFVKEMKIEDKDLTLNTGIPMYRTNTPTAPQNSGSPVFNPKTGKVLGITTTGVKIKSGKESRVEAEVIPAEVIRKFLNTPGWKSKKIPQKFLSY